MAPRETDDVAGNHALETAEVALRGRYVDMLVRELSNTEGSTLRSHQMRHASALTLLLREVPELVKVSTALAEEAADYATISLHGEEEEGAQAEGGRTGELAARRAGVAGLLARIDQVAGAVRGS